MNTELFYTQWKILANSRKLTAKHFCQRAIFIALSAKNNKNIPRDDIALILLQKYFTPTTNANKLNNGETVYNDIDAFRKIQKYAVYATKTILDLPEENFFTPNEIYQYRELIKNINIDKLNRKYVYYFTTQDITPEQQGVQAGHALLKLGYVLGRNNKKLNPDKTFFQWIGVANEAELKKVMDTHNQLDYVIFRESDLNNQITSIAFHPILWNKRDEFQEYELLTH